MATRKRQNVTDSVTDYRLANLEASYSEIREAVKGIDGSLQKLASLEERHLASQEAMRHVAGQATDHEGRLRDVEKDMPTLRLVRGWVMAGVIGCAGLTGVSVWQVVLIADKLKVLAQ